MILLLRRLCLFRNDVNGEYIEKARSLIASAWCKSCKSRTKEVSLRSCWHLSGGFLSLLIVRVEPIRRCFTLSICAIHIGGTIGGLLDSLLDLMLFIGIDLAVCLVVNGGAFSTHAERYA